MRRKVVLPGLTPMPDGAMGLEINPLLYEKPEHGAYAILKGQTNAEAVIHSDGKVSIPVIEVHPYYQGKFFLVWRKFNLTK
jgi:hypothetical protein